MRMMLRSTVAAMAALTMFQAMQPAMAQSSLERDFRSPPEAAKPRFRWWWPGGAVDDAELRREITLFADAGFGGAEIQAFNPGIPDLTADERARVNHYATPDFFAHVRVAADAAAARGMSLDYTFGSSWPSGGGFAITPENALVELTMAVTAVDGGAGPIKLTIPPRTKRFGALSSLDMRVRDPRAAGWIERFDARQRIVAVVAVKGSAPDLKPAATSGFRLYPWQDVVRSGALDHHSTVVLTDKMKADGTLDWAPPPGKWQVFVFKQYASNMGVGGAAGEGPQLTLDHFSKAAFAAHAARVGDPLGMSPRGLRSTFVDSLELMQDLPWSPDFLAKFKQLRGYDLTPYLPFVVQPGWMQAWGEHWSAPYFEADIPGLAERVREDYRRTVSDLIFAGFIEPFVAWNHAHGLKEKFQAHGGAIDIVRGYGIADIPETEDLVDGGNPYFMRLARSGADLYGRPLVSAESLVWKDRAYDVTPDELRKRADLLFAGGVNSLMFHGFDYVRGPVWPGWHAFQPSGFSMGFSTMLTPTNPIWAGVPTLARYVARTQAVLQSGKPVVPVAYFYGRTGYYTGIEDSGAGKMAAEKAFISGGYDYDRINPDALAKARPAGRRLVAASGAQYGALVIPVIDNMRAETAEAVARLARAGVPVVFIGAAPTRDEGLADAHQRDRRVKLAIDAALRAGARVVPAAGVVDALQRARVPANLRFTGADTSDLIFVQRRVGTRTVTFVHNLGTASRDASMILPGRGGVARWNAMDGTMAEVSSTPRTDGTAVSLTLDGGGSALLVLDPARQPQLVPAARTIGRLDLANGWTLSLWGRSPRTAAVERDLGPVALGDWRAIDGFASFAGVGTYRRTFEIPATWLSGGTHAVLDLGEVRDMATVTVNGRALRPAITTPFRVDLTGALKAGSNVLEIAVASTPQNAMVDPKAPGFKALVPTPEGLFGPVRIEVTQ